MYYSTINIFLLVYNMYYSTINILINDMLFSNCEKLSMKSV